MTIAENPHATLTEAMEQCKQPEDYHLRKLEERIGVKFPSLSDEAALYEFVSQNRQAIRGALLEKDRTTLPRPSITEQVSALNSAAGVKFDSQKNRLDLLDWEALEGIGAVLSFGANKYAAHNWRKGIFNSRIVAAMLRHLSAIQRGELLDSESGLPHVDHLGCCWMFLSSNFKCRPEMNDLYPFTTTEKVGVDN